MTTAHAAVLDSRVSAFHPSIGATMAGTVVSVDSSHYHAVVNGRAVFRVRWDNGSEGGGWEIGGSSGLRML